MKPIYKEPIYKTLQDYGFDYNYVYYEYDDYDYGTCLDCGRWHCVCRSNFDELPLFIAECVANRIIANQNLVGNIVKEALIDERLSYYSFYGLDIKTLNDRIREDIAFIWPQIRGTKKGDWVFAQFFGQR